MTSTLDVHVASADELAAAHRNVHDLWSKGLPVEQHVRGRLESVSHRRATWFVGTIDKRVVVSLGCYPLVFRAEGRELPGIAIGSVYTVSEFRKRGFAPQLLKAVEDHARGQGTALSVLYSDIKPDYYARLGYALCPSMIAWREPDKSIAEPKGLRLTKIAPESNLPALMKMYAEYHGAAPLSIVRDEDYWRMTLKKVPDDAFCAFDAGGGKWAGYVRVGRKGTDWRITDYALADRSSELAGKLYASLLALAAREGAKRVGGWLPDGAAAKKYFKLEPRAVEITMIKSLKEDLPITDEMIAATSRFCEIDHV